MWASPNGSGEQKSYIVTGGPGSGRSDTLQALEARGYPVVKAGESDGVARGVDAACAGDSTQAGIDQRIATAYSAQAFPADRITFFDGGPIDADVLAASNGGSRSVAVRQAVAGIKPIVFMLEILPPHWPSTRPIDYSLGHRLEAVTHDAYQEYGYRVIRVPVMAAEARAKFIVRNLRFPVMVLGLPRSGTNFTATILRRHPDVSLMIEPFNLHLPSFARARGEYWDQDDYDPEYFHQSLRADAQTLGLLRAFRAQLLPQRCHFERRGFKETVLHSKLGWVYALCPNLHIIHTRRASLSITAAFIKNGLTTKWNYDSFYRGLVAAAEARPPMRPYVGFLESIDATSEWEIVTGCHLVLKHQWSVHKSRFVNIESPIEQFGPEPRLAAGRLFDFLGLDYTDDTLAQAVASPPGRSGDMYSVRENGPTSYDLPTSLIRQVSDLSLRFKSYMAADVPP